MAKKTYVLDTNVLLTDPASIFSFKDNEVILPFTVIEELDKIKNRPNEVGANAREVARKLSEMISKTTPGALKMGLDLPEGGKLRLVSLSEFSKATDEKETSSFGTDWESTNKDNLIIEVCKGLTAQAKASKKPLPILVTKDLILRIKCDYLGIPWEDYRKNSIIKNATGLYAGHSIVDVPPEVMDSYWEAIDEMGENITGKESFNCILDSYAEHQLSPNEFITIQTPGDPEDPASCSQTLRYTNSGEPLKFIRETKKSVFNLIPRNKEQTLAMDLLLDPNIKLVTLVGRAGSGKTLCSIAAGLNQVLEKKRYKSLVICRPVVPVGNDIGYLPGDMKEKLQPWIAPIVDNLRFLLFSGKRSKNSESTLQGYFDDGIIDVQAITYLRGRSIADAFIIIDEAQNISVHELKTIITRVGENTKIILTGDIEQIDASYLDSVSNGLTVAVEKFKDVNLAGHITLLKGERSELATIASNIL